MSETIKEFNDRMKKFNDEHRPPSGEDMVLGECERCGEIVYNSNHPKVTILHLWRARYWKDKIICTLCAEE